MGTEKDWAVPVSEAVNKWLCAQSEEPLSAAIHAALAEAGFVVVKRTKVERWYGVAKRNGAHLCANEMSDALAAPQPPPTLQAREGEADGKS